MKLKKAVLFFFLFIYFVPVFAVFETIHPYYGDIQHSFTELAQTRLENSYDVIMPLSGHLKRVDYRAGNQIKKGEILAQMDQLPLEQKYQEAKANLETLKSQYSNEKIELARLERLGEKNFVTKSDVDKAHTRVNVLSLGIAKAKTQLTIAQYDLERSTLTSPINGVVLSTYTEGGKWMIVGSPILRVGDLNELEVISEVLTQDAQLIKVGDQVVLSSTTSPILLKGQVKRIEPEGFTKKSSLGVDEQRVKVITTIEDPEKANVQVGYRLLATFLVGTPRKNTVLIPRFSVLQDNEGHYYVFKVENDTLKKQVITIDVKTDALISVKTGLTVNDSIVSQPTADMHDGMQI